MRKSRFLFFAITIALFTAQMQLIAAAPAGAVAAKPNVVYYAGGSCKFYDAAGVELLSVSSDEAGWSASPAKTAWVVVTPTYGGYYEFPNFDATKTPTFSTTRAMKPFWHTDTIYNELVLLTGVNSTSKLMFPPKKIISVTNYDYSKTFATPTDYTIAGRTITQKSATVSATYVTKAGVKGSGGSNGLTNVNPTSWTNVTYIPDYTGWDSTNIVKTLNYKGDKLTKTMAKLKAKQPVVIEFYGMSITAGLNTSGFKGDDKNFIPTKPYLHSYADLSCQQLQKLFGSTITMINGSCGGKTAAWTDQYVSTMVTPNNPDLVVLDQGMNDIWGTSNAAFNASMKSAIQKIQTACPNAEIILLGNMLPDQTGAGAPSNGASLMYGLTGELKKLEGPGVVCIDFTQVSDTIYKRKGVASCLSNSLHPNDWLARCYAQAIVAAFTATGGVPTDIQPGILASSEFLSVQPNPVVDGHFILKIADDVVAENAIISVYDLAGKQVASFKQSSSSKDYISSDLNMSSGVYIFKAQVDGKVSTQKVVVK